jgi:hypothetical protein
MQMNREADLMSAAAELRTNGARVLDLRFGAASKASALCR